MDRTESVFRVLCQLTSAKFNMLRIFLFIPVVMIIFGCTTRVERDEIIGAYQSDLPFGTEILELKPDGRYTQILTIRGENKNVSHSGAWKYRPEVSLLELQDALQFDDNFGTLNPSYKIPGLGIWVLNVEKIFGRVSLAWAPDFDFKFKKMQSSENDRGTNAKGGKVVLPN